MSIMEQKKHVVAMSYDLGTWKDLHMLKDCGLVPYYFYDIYHYDVVMVGAELGEYPSCKCYLPGLKLEFLKDNTYEARVEYIQQHAKEIDLLILEGVFLSNLVFSKEYKRLNPNGKVYLQTDMNSGFNEWVFTAYPELIELGTYADVIASSGRLMQSQLNKKLPWCVEYIPNGYFDKVFGKDEIDYSKKKNVILSVGRLGSWQKATEVLLEGFAQVADKIPDWEFELVGTVEPEFESVKQTFFDKNPNLECRIRFCGPIFDKEELAKKYRTAKIFALPSRFEGGTPNVISEALISGCATLVSRFDAYEDATDKEKCGMDFPMDDVDVFSEKLEYMCTSECLKDMCSWAEEYAHRNYDYRIIIRRLHYLLFGEA